MKIFKDDIEVPNTPPIVLMYIDGDQYGGDATCWPGVGMPEVIVFDGGRYDKYNWVACEHDGGPREDYADALEKLKDHEAGKILLDWVEGTEKALGISAEDDHDD